MEKLYDYDISVPTQILESYWGDKKEALFVKAFYSFKIAAYSNSQKGFKIDDFTGLLGDDFIENMQKQSYKETRAYIEELKADGQDY